MQCPFCLEEVKPDALVCRTCTRDIAVPKPLMEANARLTVRVAELGMSCVVHVVDGDPILPSGAVVWRETLEYVASIALAYVLGSLLRAALWPLHRPRNSLIDRAATMPNPIAQMESARASSMVHLGNAE